MAPASSSGPARVFLLIGEDPFRARLRLAEIVEALIAGAPTEPGDLASRPSPALGAAQGTGDGPAHGGMLLGVTRHDARVDPSAVIEMSGRSQGLFDAPDERRVVVVEHAEAIADPSFIARFPPETALVLLTAERIAAGRRRARPKRGEPPPAADLIEAVDAAGGRVERIARLLPDQVQAWIAARARSKGVALEPAAASELAAAVAADTDRLEQELAKLGTYAAGAQVSAADVRALVAGAIEADVFELTRAVVRRDARTALDRLERLLAEGQAPQQILALLLWQYRVVLFASAMRTNADAERMARAIRSSAGAIARWQHDARRLSRTDVIRAYEALYATDLAIKQGRTEPETALTLCVLDLCGVAGADPRELIVGEPPRR